MAAAASTSPREEMMANSAPPPMSEERAAEIVSSSAASPDVVSALALDKRVGVVIEATTPVYVNLSYEQLTAHTIKNKEVAWTKDGVPVVDTGKFTGRSPLDKFFVKREPSASKIDWGEINQPCSAEAFDTLHARACAHLSDGDGADSGRHGRPVYVFCGYAGHSEEHRKRILVVTTLAWQQQFLTNMLIPATGGKEELLEFLSAGADFTILNACGIRAEDFASLGLHSPTFVLFDIERETAVIGDTKYGGEMKKGVFSVMNYLMPLLGHLSMHCAANADKATGATSLFFGLSGTGKTTLSADPDRLLIGDDEHVWADDGVFNIEGGCYAKTKGLKAEDEPEIAAAIAAPCALLENVKLLPGGVVDYDDCTKTENGRVSYPLTSIPARVPEARGTHPSVVIFLTADAFGVLPPVSRLSETKRALYWFVSGFTAKVAGTERGVSEPVPTFSHSFGSPFFPLHASDYAEILGRKVEEHGASVFLINSGWSGGPCGAGGSRMPIAVTRACVTAAVNGVLDSATYRKDPNFGVDVPTSVPGVPDAFLDPRSAWSDPDAYDKQAEVLCGMFRENYEQFRQSDKPDYSDFAPQGRSAAAE